VSSSNITFGSGLNKLCYAVQNLNGEHPDAPMHTLTHTHTHTHTCVMVI